MVGPVDALKSAYRKEYERNPVFTLFLTILIVFFMIFVIAAFITGGDTIYNVLNANRSYVFSDFFESVATSNNRLYNVIYPPLIVVFYLVIRHFVTPYVDIPPGASVDEQMMLLRGSQMGIMLFVVITLVTFYVLYLVFSKTTKEEGIRKGLLFAFLVLLAYPFLYALERGNSIIMALVFCFIFLLGYRSENKYIRYASYIALGCAAGIKIYPAILGLLILRDRNYKEMAKCVLIVAILAFVPFLITGGTPLLLLDNILSWSAASLGFTNISQIVTAILQEGLGMASGTVSIISYVFLGIFTLLSFIVILFDKEMKFWKVIALIGCNLILGFGIGVQYQIIYMLPAMLLFLNSERELTRGNLFYIICFAMMMVLIPGIVSGVSLFGAAAYPSAAIGAMESFFVILVAIALLHEGIARLCRNRRGTSPETDAAA